MTLRASEPPGAQHLLEGFDCGKPALNDWLLRHARQAQDSGSAKTFVVADDERVAGYFGLTVGKVDTLEAPGRIRKGMGQYPVPVVILARLAVSRGDQGRGIGAGMLQDTIRRTFPIAEQAGIRAMLTHPIDEAAKFYGRFGFIASPLREQQLLLLLKMPVGQSVSLVNTHLLRCEHSVILWLVPSRPIREQTLRACSARSTCSTIESQSCASN